MKVLIDTNVVLDWLMNRRPFGEIAKAIMEKCILGDLEGYLAGHTLADLFYILRKDFEVRKRKKLLLFLCDSMKIIPEDKKTIERALINDKWNDLEDGLQMQCAKNAHLDYIITRNTKDFINSFVPAIQPETFLDLYEKNGF